MPVVNKVQGRSRVDIIGWFYPEKPEVEIFWWETPTEYLISDGPILNFNFRKTFLTTTLV